MSKIKELQNLLKLEQLEENIFRGESENIGSGRVFGGQALAQALSAAYETVSQDRFVHSLHGYFILAGDHDVPIVYEVDRIRDGGSFTTRRVVAIQKGRAIFNMSASFQIEEEGFDHQIDMINVPPPESLISMEKSAELYGKNWPAPVRNFYMQKRPIEFRHVEVTDPMKPGHRPPIRHVWMRAKSDLPKDKRLHQTILAYASDYNLLITSMLPHNIQLWSRNMQVASLDHAMWFHRAFLMDDWLLYALDSPSASNARGFCRGNIFTREGVLVASVTQEGLIRQRKKKSQKSG